jgi:hypothetical protein
VSPEDFIKNTLKDAPSGVHIVLKGTIRDEASLMATSYCTYLLGSYHKVINLSNDAMLRQKNQFADLQVCWPFSSSTIQSG